MPKQLYKLAQEAEITPWSFSFSEYRKIFARIWRELNKDNVGVISAGVAFYCMLSIFPLITALISLFGFVADPAVVQGQLEEVSEILPPEAWDILNNQIMAVVSAPAPSLGLGIFVSLVLMLWSAGSGIRAMMRAMNVAYDRDETRGFFTFAGEAGLFTLSVGVFMWLAIYVIIWIPALLSYMRMEGISHEISTLLPWVILIGYFALATGILYRLGPSRHNAPFIWILPGVIFATLGWLVISIIFARFVEEFGTYNRVYGGLSAVIILQVWFWLTALVIIIGAEINAELERFGFDKAKNQITANPL